MMQPKIGDRVKYFKQISDSWKTSISWVDAVIIVDVWHGTLFDFLVTDEHATWSLPISKSDILSISNQECNCEIRLLMNRGCRCGAKI